MMGVALRYSKPVLQLHFLISSSEIRPWIVLNYSQQTLLLNCSFIDLYHSAEWVVFFPVCINL